MGLYSRGMGLYSRGVGLYSRGIDLYRRWVGLILEGWGSPEDRRRSMVLGCCLPARLNRSATMWDFIFKSIGESQASDGDRLTSRTQGRRLESNRMSKPYTSGYEQ